MFTKLILPFGNAYFLESAQTLRFPGNPYGLKKTRSKTSWLALVVVVLCHIGLLTALRNEPQPVAPETPPKPIMVTMVSEQPMTNNNSTASIPPPKQVHQKPVKPKVKPIKLKKATLKPVESPKLFEKPVLKREPDTQRLAPENVSTPSSNAETSSDAAEHAKAKSKPETISTKYQEPSFNAGYLHNPPPRYPPVSRSMGEQGRVLLNVAVSVDGSALSVALHASSGSDRLDEAAIAAVRKWRFVPARRGGQAVSASVVVPIKFSLEG